MNISNMIKTMLVVTIIVATSFFGVIQASTTCGTSGVNSSTGAMLNYPCTSDGDCCGSPDNNTYCIPTSSSSSSGYCSCAQSGCFCSENSDCSSNLCVLESGQIYGYCSCAPENDCACTANGQCGSNYCYIKNGSSGTCKACTSSSCNDSMYSCSTSTGSLVCQSVAVENATSCVSGYCYANEVSCTTQSSCGTGAQCYNGDCQACNTSGVGIFASCTNDGDCCDSSDGSSYCMTDNYCSCTSNGCPCDTATNTDTDGQNSSCTSGLCFNNSCSYAPANNGSCMLTSQCSSNLCTIPSGSTVGQCTMCAANTDCAGSLYGAYCVNGICMENGAECLQDSDCSSGYCDTTNYVCVNSTTCSDGTTCSTGNCDTTTGTCIACQDAEGLNCLNDGDCCNSTCTTSSGETCSAGDTCSCSCAPTNGCPCSSNGQCYGNVCTVPTGGTVQACQACTSDSDCNGSSYGAYCAVGACIPNQPECTQDSDCPSPGSCDMTNYVCVSSTTCSDSITCATGTCDTTTETCTECLTGGYTCISDGDCCDSICYLSSDGAYICSFAPAVGGYCTTDDQCYSNVCTANACVLCTIDSDCTGSSYGSYCNPTNGQCSTEQSDCQNGSTCSSGYCNTQTNGANACSSCQAYNYICANDGDCCSDYCNVGICDYYSMGQTCTTDSQCGITSCYDDICATFICVDSDNDYSKQCMEIISTGCSNNDPNECSSAFQVTSPCTENSQCPDDLQCDTATGYCSTEPSECSNNSDCSSGSCVIDTTYDNNVCTSCQSNTMGCDNDGQCCSDYCSDNICSQLENGQSCSSNAQCESTYCSNGKCCAGNGEGSNGDASNCCCGYQSGGFCGYTNGQTISDQIGVCLNTCGITSGTWWDEATNTGNAIEGNGTPNRCCALSGQTSGNNSYNCCLGYQSGGICGYPNNTKGCSLNGQCASGICNAGTCAGVATGGSCWTSQQCSSNSSNVCSGASSQGNNQQCWTSGTCQPS
jgi:hypothetical protein